jgi:hypothetical protein
MLTVSWLASFSRFSAATMADRLPAPTLTVAAATLNTFVGTPVPRTLTVLVPLPKRRLTADVS